MDISRARNMRALFDFSKMAIINIETSTFTHMQISFSCSRIISKQTNEKKASNTIVWAGRKRSLLPGAVLRYDMYASIGAQNKRRFSISHTEACV